MTMLRICSAVSGEELALVEVEQFQGKSSKELKSFLAARLGHTRFRQRLFDEDDKEIDGDKLALSPQNMRLVVLELLPPDEEQDKDFFSACVQNRLDKVEAFLRRPQDPNVKEPDGMTALHLAAARGHEQCVDLLLEALANLEAKLLQGTTALHMAARRNQAKMVKFLVEKGADKDMLTDDAAQVTAMHFAASEGYMDVLLTLISLKAGVDIGSTAGATPLHFAALSGHRDIAQVLLREGGDVLIPHVSLCLYRSDGKVWDSMATTKNFFGWTYLVWMTRMMLQKKHLKLNHAVMVDVNCFMETQCIPS